jgi:hypothetical protein
MSRPAAPFAEFPEPGTVIARGSSPSILRLQVNESLGSIGHEPSSERPVLACFVNGFVLYLVARILRLKTVFWRSEAWLLAQEGDTIVAWKLGG